MAEHALQAKEIINGRPHTIKGFLHGLRLDADVLGYVDKDHGSPGPARLHAKGVSPAAIAERALWRPPDEAQ